MARPSQFIRSIALLTALLLTALAHAAPVDAPQPAQTPQKFVGEFFGNFYAGYLKYMSSSDRKLANFKKLFEPRNYFSDTLSNYLIAGERAQLASPGELTGLDFDPFVDAQDEVGKPLIGEAKALGQGTRVKVTFSTLPKHLVIYELSYGPQGFFVSNIIYPEERTDLLKLFAEQKKSEPLPAGGASISVAGEYKRYIGGKLDANQSTIKVKDLAAGRIHIDGNAVWVGNAATGDVNTKELDGDARLDGNKAMYMDPPEGGEGSCSLTMVFKQGTLTVTGDSMNCGGLNVTFNGEYIRSP